LPDQWEEPVTVPIYKKDNKTDLEIIVIKLIQKFAQCPSLQNGLKPGWTEIKWDTSAAGLF
jgi:hypothetical protein